jgi:hypothetical protein
MVAKACWHPAVQSAPAQVPRDGIAINDSQSVGPDLPHEAGVDNAMPVELFIVPFPGQQMLPSRALSFGCRFEGLRWHAPRFCHSGAEVAKNTVALISKQFAPTSLVPRTAGCAEALQPARFNVVRGLA